jgi:hypothetical protein
MALHVREAPEDREALGSRDDPELQEPAEASTSEVIPKRRGRWIRMNWTKHERRRFRRAVAKFFREYPLT